MATGAQEVYARWPTVQKYRWAACVVVAIPLLCAFYAPVTARSPYFVAAATAICVQVGIFIAPRSLWFQFEPQVTWADIHGHPRAQCIVLVVSNIATVVGLAVCVTVLARRYHTGDLASMSTVAEIGSTLFLAKEAQRLAGRPALSFGKMHIQSQARRARADIAHRPRFTTTSFPNPCIFVSTNQQ